MPYLIEWCIPQRVLLCRFSGDLSRDDAQQAADRVHEMIQAGAAPVHAIIDVTQLGKFPASASQLNQISRWVYLPATGWIVTINPNRLMSLLVSIITNMARVKHRSAADMSEAFDVLKRVDTSLPASLPA